MYLQLKQIKIIKVNTIKTYFIFTMSLSCYKIIFYFSLSVKLYRQGIACWFLALHPHSKWVLRNVNLGKGSSISKILCAMYNVLHYGVLQALL